MIGCCAFYLAWWLIAFKPEGAIKGIRNGWLLIPALLFGVMAVVQIIQGSGDVESNTSLFPQSAVLIGGVAAYIVLLVGSSVILKRQVMTELFLIVGWILLFGVDYNILLKMETQMKKHEKVEKHPPEKVIFMNMCMLCDGDQILALDKTDNSECWISCSRIA